MKLGSKKAWKSFMPLRLGRRSSSRFCMFPKVRSASQTSGNTPVYLNVYDLTHINGYMYWAGLGVFHTGIEGSLCNCLLPEALKITAVQHDPDAQSEDGEKRRLRSAFSCLSSISMRQRQFSTSSLLLTSPLRGCLSHWELRRSGAIALKDN